MPGLLILLIAQTSCSTLSDDTGGQNMATDSVPYDSLRLVLEAVYDADQAIRQELIASWGGDVGKLFSGMAQIDSVNQMKVKTILSAYGWLPQTKVGEKASDAIFLVVQHGGEELIREHLPHLKKQVKQNEAKATHAAMMEDRLLMYEGKKQIYGTQASGDTTGGGFVWPIKDPERVNQLRREKGFDLTVEENAERLGVRYNPKQELPKAVKD
ncbi:DUF6624 domain-containing protein [Parapedobacter lycopersici]|uniref:DUF6624 domain-containing protein n=1 Tax=Parapedobacter lycopersici TaxID=1864939 RepID=UPI00214D814C|nr:DUF6624 domain-containing protein [Parapedobacter lycopersici]